jgi:hypothetical protein
MTHNEKSLTSFMDSSAESTILSQISALAKQIELSFSGAKIDLEFYSSGAAMLDIHCNNRLFVLAYSPNNGFGVDEVKDEDFFGMGFSFSTNHFNVAAEQLNKLIQSV